MDVRRWSRRVPLVLAAGILAFLGAELAARWLLDPPIVNTHMVADPVLGYHLPTDVDRLSHDERGSFPYRLNSLGFPGPELPSGPPPPGVERILVVGDSFLNPWMIREEEWVVSTLRAERARSGPEPEVYAICSDDYGTGQELLLLRQHVERVAPTTVVLLLYPGNDVINNSLALAGRTTISPGDYYRPYLVDDGAGELELCYALPWKARLRKLRLFSLVEAEWLARFGVPAELREELAGDRVLTTTQRIRRNLLPDEHYELFRPAPVAGSPWERAWRDTEAQLIAFRDEVRARGARFVTVVIPFLFQVLEEANRVAVDERLRIGQKPPLGATLDWNWPERHLEAVLHREGIEHVTMLGPVRQLVEETRSSVYRRDGHLIGSAHALMGRRIAARLAPDASDECFSASAHPSPVPLSRLHPGELDLDLRRASHFELFAWGWNGWAPGEKDGGWQLGSEGLFLAPNRAGTLTLRGRLQPGNRFPVTLAVAFNYRTEIARQTFEGPGEYVFSVALQPMAEIEDEWLALKLSVLERKPEEPSGLVLDGLSFAP